MISSLPHFNPALKAKIDYIIILIFLYFCLSIISSNYNLANYDQIKLSNSDNKFNHVMIKSDPLKYLTHGAEIKRDLKNGIGYFKTGEQNFTKYLPARLAAAYYYFFDYDLFNNWSEKKVNLGIHSYYLFIQCVIYYFSLFYLYLVISKKIPKRICFFITMFLGLEPTIFQYHGTFWSESIFFSLQLLLLALIIRNSTNFLNFFWIGLFLALLSIQRSPAFLYIIPTVIYLLIVLEKKIYPKILFILIGYSIILLFIGYHNYVRAGVFYIVPNDTRSNVNRYLVPSIINADKQINETKLALKWIKNNQIEINVKKIENDLYNSKPYIFCEGSYIKNEKDKLKFCNYLRSRTIKLLLDDPTITLKHILYRSFHTLLLNPFHIYSEHHFISDDLYYKSSTNQKLIPLRIIYTSIIFFISLIGFIKLVRNKDKNLFILFTLSAFYFFITTSWHGSTRYFVPVLIYLSLFFGNGSISIIDFFNKKFLKK